MSELLYTTATGAIAQRMRLGMLANNLANVDTVGFKSDAPRFSAFMPNGADRRAQADPAPGAPLTPNVHVAFNGGRTDFSQGRLKPTGNVLDLALRGDGFLTVETPAGLRYTRQGVFALSPQGLLVTEEGYPVLGEAGPVRIDGSRVEIGEDGAVRVDGNRIARLKVVDFARPYRLEKAGAALFRPVDETVVARPAEGVTVHQGMVETSNVTPIHMMSEMIEVLRAYESCQKVMRTVEDLETKLTGEASRTV